MRARSAGLLGLFTALVLSAASCTSDEAPAPPAARSALLITLDTTRHDALGVYGAAPGVTPAIDALAAESLVFDVCRTVAPLTLPSHASMLTGRYPPGHGIRDNGYAVLPDDVPTLAERARDGGLRTAAFVAAVVLERRFGLARGFETYVQPERAAQEVTHVYAERPADAVVGDAIRWLAELGADERFLAWVHLFDPHAPYRPPARFAEQAGGDAYLGEVARADHAVGELLAALRDAGRLDSTLVVLTADHGEDRMQHGEPTHASFCYDTTLRVPLLVRWPDGWRAGERCAAVTSVVDVFPTLLAALGLADPGGHDGLDLSAAAASALSDEPAGRGVYFETFYNFIHYGWSPLVGWADAGGKYIHGASPELYRTGEDPGEERNVAGQAPAELARYVRAIEQALGRTHAGAGAQAAPDAELARSLTSLGYAEGARPASLPSPLELAGSGELPTPRERLAELHAFLEASELSDQGRCDEALPLFARVVEDNPRNRIALDRYAFCLIQARAWDRAREALELRVACGEAGAATHINLGVCLQNLRRFDDALGHYERALELDPTHRTGRENLARLLERLGRQDEATRVRAASPR